MHTGSGTFWAQVWALARGVSGERLDHLHVDLLHRLGGAGLGQLLYLAQELLSGGLGDLVDAVLMRLAGERLEPPPGRLQQPQGAVTAVCPGQVSSLGMLANALEQGPPRAHQVRVQAASRGHPIVGDEIYGSTMPFGVQHDDVRLRAIALHARSLTFDQPATSERVTVTAAPGPAWLSLGLEPP